MGAYEQFFLKEKVLTVEQIKVLKEFSIQITTRKSVLAKRANDDEATILGVQLRSIPATLIVDQYITACNCSWKDEFRKALKKSKIRFRSKVLVD